MPPSGTNSQDQGHPGALPLFRPEALAAQEKLLGEILLIRPFSLVFFGWLGAALGAVLLGFLLLGHPTETARVSGFLLPDHQASSASGLEAVFYVPVRWMRLVHPGATLSLRCPACADPSRRLTGTVIQVAEAAQEQSAQGAARRVTLELSPEILPLLSQGVASSGVALEAEVPLGRKSLIHWLVEPSPR